MIEIPTSRKPTTQCRYLCRDFWLKAELAAAGAMQTQTGPRPTMEIGYGRARLRLWRVPLGSITEPKNVTNKFCSGAALHCIL